MSTNNNNNDNRINSFDPSTFNLVTLFDKMKPNWKKIWNKVYQENPNLFKDLEAKLNNDTITYGSKLLIFPPKDQIFETFYHFDLEDTKVVILGQDPYHKFGQAHGLSFSVKDGIKPPPSLVNIFKELRLEYKDFTVPKSGNLTKWLDQGVLLLNNALTVLESNPNEYEKYWSPITNLVMKEISEQHKEGIIFLLWGAFAQSKSPIQKQHHILKSAHPSPLSANNGFFGCNHFVKTNEILTKNGKKIIDWTLL